MQPAIYASAFAQASFNGTSAASAGFAAATGYFSGSPGFYPDDYYAYLGQARFSKNTSLPRDSCSGKLPHD